MIVAFASGCISAASLTGRAPETSPFATPPNLTPPAEEVGQFIVGNAAIEEFRSRYWKAKEHKAFASSESGAWGWSSDSRPAQRAKDRAWVACQAHVPSGGPPCEIVNFDGVWQRPSPEHNPFASSEGFEGLDAQRGMSNLTQVELGSYCLWAEDLADQMWPHSDPCPDTPSGRGTPQFACDVKHFPSTCVATVEDMRRCTRVLLKLTAKYQCELRQKQFDRFRAELSGETSCRDTFATCIRSSVAEPNAAPDAR